MYAVSKRRFTMNLLWILGISTLHIAKGINEVKPYNDEEMKDPMTIIAVNEERFALELYKATAATKTGYFAISVLDTIRVLSILPKEYGLNKQFHDFFNYSSDDRIARSQDNEIERCDESPFFGKSYNKIFHAYEKSDRETLRVQKHYGLSSKYITRVASWDELTSGRTIYEWAMEQKHKYPHKQTFDGEKSFVHASIVYIYSKYNLPYFNVREFESSFYYNDKIAVSNVNFLEFITQTKYGEFEYRRNSNDGYAKAKYITLRLKNLAMYHLQLHHMIIILPNEKDGIVELEKNIDEVSIRQIFSNRQKEWVNAILPEHIQFDSANNLEEPLKNMGLTEMFNANVWVKGNKTIPINVGPVLQQFKLSHEWSLDEATKWEGPIPENAKTFNANHAFLVLIVASGRYPIIMYMGRHGMIPGATDAAPGIVV